MNKQTYSENIPTPAGNLVLRTLVQKQDTNIYGDIGASWVIAQMEAATQMVCNKFKPEKIATVAMSQMDFISPIRVGEQIDIYAQIKKTGNSSIHINLEVWRKLNSVKKYHKVTDGTFVLVVLDSNGRIKLNNLNFTV